MEDLWDWKMGSHLSSSVTASHLGHMFKQYSDNASFSTCQAIFTIAPNKGCACILLRCPLSYSHTRFYTIHRNLLNFVTLYLSHSLKNCSLHYQRDSHITSIQLYVLSSLNFPASCSLWCENLDSVNSFDIAFFVSLFPQWSLVQLSADISTVLIVQKQADTSICHLHPTEESDCCSLWCLRYQRCWHYVTYDRGILILRCVPLSINHPDSRAVEGVPEL